MTIIGDQLCTFPNCHEPAIAHIIVLHRVQSGTPIEAKHAVCELHLNSVMDSSAPLAYEMLKAAGLEVQA